MIGLSHPLATGIFEIRRLANHDKFAAEAADLLIIEARGNKPPINTLTRDTVFKNSVLGIIEQDRKLVAAVGFAVNRGSPPKARHITLVQEIATIDERRGYGLARQLLHEVALIGSAAGDSAMELFARPEAVEFYEHLGFAMLAHTYTDNDYMHISLHDALQ